MREQTQPERIKVAIHHELYRVYGLADSTIIELKHRRDQVAALSGKCGCVNAHLRLRIDQLRSQKKRLRECEAYLRKYLRKCYARAYMAVETSTDGQTSQVLTVNYCARK